VKLGYVQVTEVIFVQAVIATVWSGAELVITNLSAFHPVHSAKVIQVQAAVFAQRYQAAASLVSYFTFSSLQAAQV